MKRFLPFTEFTVDIPDIKRRLLFSLQKERLNDFVSDSHLARFGCPLRLAYHESDKIARTKLIGSRFGEVYRPEDRDHVFAVLSVRICLDLDLVNPVAVPVSHSAVSVHMRKLNRFDPATGAMFTKSPMESILSKATMQRLYARRFMTGIEPSRLLRRSFATLFE